MTTIEDVSNEQIIESYMYFKNTKKLIKYIIHIREELKNK
jgi:hypothetical protein